MFNTPIAFIIFNRPDTTQKVFNRIREVKPTKLLVIADGARKNHPDDVLKCQTARDIIQKVDWQCEILTNYAKVNLGCAKRIETGLNWVFEQVNSAIILEDDCLPDITFFPFAQQLLEKYAQCDRIMHIGGHNRLFQWRVEKQSYHFSYLYGSPHGWATWKRAWQHYSQDDSSWNNPDNLAYLEKVIVDERQRRQFEQLCAKIFTDPTLQDEWGYKWTFVKLAKKGLSLIPATNLVTHIGAGINGTHIKHKTLLNGSSLPQQPISFPLIEPSSIEVDLEFEKEHSCWSVGEPNAHYLQPLITKLIATGKNINALILIDKALSQNPDSLKFNLQKAKTLINLRQKKRAIPILKKILTFEANHLEAKMLMNVNSELEI